MKLFFFAATISLIVLASTTGLAQTQTCKKSVCFENTKIIAAQTLPIRGLGLLKYLMFDLYTAALYAPAENTTIDSVLGNTPKSLVLHYHHAIKKEIMIKASRDRISNNPEVDAKNLEDRLKQLDAAYQNVQKGDRYELRFEPGIGTSLLLNGKLQATIVGEDFQKAFFGIWLSRVPLSRKLRDTLLQSKQK